MHEGLVAFFPVPAEVELVCGIFGRIGKEGISFDDKYPTYYLNAPITVNLYTESHFLDPQRDFLTSPQDGLTFSSGFIVGHKFSDQSAAKTIVDTVTGPIRAMMPTVSVTQSTTVQSTGARSTSTSTTTGPPKAP
jgi:hypothetical protein